MIFFCEILSAQISIITEMFAQISNNGRCIRFVKRTVESCFDSFGEILIMALYRCDPVLRFIDVMEFYA